MVINKKRIEFGLFKIDVINYIEKLFSLYHRKSEVDDYIRTVDYAILDTDIDLKISSYSDYTIAYIYFCTWEGGWEHKQKSLYIEYHHKGYYEIRDNQGKRKRLENKELVFKTIDKYFNLVCAGIIRDKKLSKLLA